jgi:hypothetical protein
MQAPFNPNQLELPLQDPVLKLSEFKLYCGDYWVDFPRSEYGGTWAVLAQNKADCINMLYNACNDYEIEGYEHDIAEAVDKAMVFDVVAAEGQFSKVVSFFRT